MLCWGAAVFRDKPQRTRKPNAKWKLAFMLCWGAAVFRDEVSKTATNDKIQSSRRFTDMFSHLSKNRSTSNRCHCHFVHSFFCYNLFVFCDRKLIIGCKSNQKLRILQILRDFFCFFFHYDSIMLFFSYLCNILIINNKRQELCLRSSTEMV